MKPDIWLRNTGYNRKNWIKQQVLQQVQLPRRTDIPLVQAGTLHCYHFSPNPACTEKRLTAVRLAIHGIRVPAAAWPCLTISGSKQKLSDISERRDGAPGMSCRTSGLTAGKDRQPCYREGNEMNNTIEIDGETYVKELKKNDMEFAIVRTCSAGVFAGYIESRDYKEATLRSAIRLWHWEGAASLSQLAMEGVAKPDGCKFAMPVEKVILTEVIEIIPTTDAAKQNIEGVPSWKV